MSMPYSNSKTNSTMSTSCLENDSLTLVCEELNECSTEVLSREKYSTIKSNQAERIKVQHATMEKIQRNNWC